MILGIVGHEAAKFTPETETRARVMIRYEMQLRGAALTLVVSGESPLGGVDIWAREEAVAAGIPFIGFKPLQHRWDAPYGFKARNLDIAHTSDLVLCVVVATLPESYIGMRFDGCYHCGDRTPPHVKSGGCWTAWRAKSRAWRIV